MKFMVSWALSPATYRNTVTHFLQTGGPPPAGVKMIGRWHGMSGGGCAIVETNDANALYAWVAEWAEYMPLQTTPVLDDAEAGQVLGGMFK